MNILLFDMNDKFPGKADPATFPAKVAAFDFAPFRGAHVQLKGCAPSWAHLLVAARLQPLVAQLDFLVDDGKGGVVVPLHAAHHC